RAVSDGTVRFPAGRDASARIDADSATAKAGTTWRKARRWSPPNTTTRSGSNREARSAASASPSRNLSPKRRSTSRSLPGLWLAHTTIRSDVTADHLPKVTLMLDDSVWLGQLE